MFAVPNLCGIGAEEDGRRRDECAVDNGVIDRDVMAFKTPAPRSVTAGRAKDDEVVEIGIAREPPSGTFYFGEDGFQVDDCSGFGPRLFAQSGIEQGKCFVSLMRFHVFEREAQSVARDVVPVLSCVFIAEAQLRGRRLIGTQRCQKCRGSIGHAIGRVNLGIEFFEVHVRNSL